MKPNPFCQPNAPSWLTVDQDPAHRTPPQDNWGLLVNFLEFRDYTESLPGLSGVVKDTLHSLMGIDVVRSLQERRWKTAFPDSSPSLPSLPSSPAAILGAFFAQVTHPIAEMIDTIFAFHHLRSVSMVEEIMHRMAQSVGATPLPFGVATAVCCALLRRRISLMPEDMIEVQATTWCISWQQTSVHLLTAHTGLHPHTAQESYRPFLVFVNDETTGKILAFRSTQGPPSEADILFTLSDALIFPYQDTHRSRLPMPAHLRFQRPVPSRIVKTAQAWGINVEQIEEGEDAGAVGATSASFLRQWEQALKGRVFDPIQYVRIFDRACERAFGYAPFLAKRRAVQRIGFGMRLEDDPSWRMPSLRELLPVYHATVGTAGTLLWNGWHYRDMDNDLLRYWPNEEVTLRPSPVNEAMIWVYWPGEEDQAPDTLCCAIAEELRHKDGSYRPYFFPYPRLGE